MNNWIIIANEYVLTSANCVDGANIIAAVLSINETTDLSMKSSEFGIHPEWNPNNLNGNIAWIKLPQPVDLSEYLILKFMK